MAREQTDWRQVGLIWVVGLLAAAQFSKVSLNFERLRGLYDRPDPELALIVSAVGIPGIVLGAMAGMAVARLGARRVLLWAMAVAGVLSLLQAALPPFWPFVGLRILEGGAHLAIAVASPVLIAAASTHRHESLVMAFWASFFGVSFALSAPIFALIGDMQVILAGHGLAFWLLLPLCWLWVSRDPAIARPWPGVIATHRSIYSDPHKTAPGLAFFWHTLIFVALLTFLPEQIAGPLPQPVIASILSVMALAGIFLAGWMARFVDPLRLCVISFGVTLGVALLLPVFGGGAQIALAVILFIVIGVVPGAGFAAIPALNADAGDQAEANGAMAQFGNVGTSVGTPLFAIALSLAAMPGLTAMTLFACVCGMGTVLWIISRLR